MLLSMRRFCSKKLISNYNHILPLSFNYNINKRFFCLTQDSLKSNDTRSNHYNSNSPTEEPKETKISFYSKINICKNCYVLRFMLPDSDQTSGLKTGQYVYLSAHINNKTVSKPYHPISLDTDKGFIDIMIKVYTKEADDPSYGIFSNYLSTLEVY